MLTSFHLDDLLIDLKKELEKSTDSFFSKDHNKQFDLFIDGKRLSFELNYDYHQHHMNLSFDKLFWDTNSSKKKLFQNIIQTIYDYFLKKEFSFFINVHSPYSLSFLGFETNTIPVGEIALKIQKIQDMIPSKFIRGEKELFLDHSFELPFEIMILPEFLNSSIRFVKRMKEEFNWEFNWDSLSEKTFFYVKGEQDLRKVLLLLQNEYDSYSEVLHHMNELSIKFGRKVNVAQILTGGLMIGAPLTKFRHASIDHSILLATREMNEIERFNTSISEFLSHLMNKMPTSYYYSSGSLDLDFFQSFYIFIGGSIKEVTFSLSSTYDHVFESIFYKTSFTFEKNTHKGDMLDVFDYAKKTILQTNKKENMVNLFKEEQASVFNRLFFEFALPLDLSKIRTGIPLSTVKTSLENHYKKHPFIPREKELESLTTDELTFSHLNGRIFVSNN